MKRVIFFTSLLAGLMFLASAALASVPVVQYGLDDNAFNTTVLATYGNEGTTQSFTTFLSSTDTPLGRAGNSMLLGNGGPFPQTVEIGDPRLPTIPSLTVSCWIKPNQAIDYLQGVMGRVGDGSSAATNWTGLWNRWGSYSLDYGDQLSWMSGLTSEVGVWQFVAASLDSTGQNVVKWTQSGGWETAARDFAYTGSHMGGDWAIGLFPASYAENSTRVFDGLLDEVRISGEARLDFASLKGWPLPTPVADAGPDISVNVDGHGGSCCACPQTLEVAHVMMDGSNSSQGESLTFTWEAPIPWMDGAECNDNTVEAVNPTGLFPVGSTTVTLVVDDGNYMVTDTMVVTVSPGCYTGPDRYDWIEVGMPDCWCNPHQCHGDADGILNTYGRGGAMSAWVEVPDIDILVKGFRQEYSGDPAVDGPDLDSDTDNWICADFDHMLNTYGRGGALASRVGVPDIEILVYHFRNSHGVPPADCLTANPVSP